MRKNYKFIFANFLCLFSLGMFAQEGKVVISQAYGGGGNTGATYTHDYIELFNSGTEAVNLEGWSVQYASASGSSWSNHTVLPNFNLQPGQYYLIQQGPGAGGTEPLPSPDLIAENPIAMSGTNFKLILVNNSEVATGTNPTGSSIMDKVGFGTASGFEGTVAPALSNTTAGFRKLGGCQDTDDNLNDFETGTPTPRNSSTQFNNCHEEVNVPVESITVTAEGETTLTTAGAQVQLIATINPTNATNQGVVWSIVSGDSFATIDANGLVTAVATGNPVFRATAIENETIFDEIEITINIENVSTPNFNESNVKVFPNPTTGIFVIESLTTVKTVSVFNMLGQNIMTINGQNNIDLTSLNNGVYFVKIQNNEGNTLTKKIVKK